MGNWMVRVAVVGGLTWLGLKYAPAGVGKSAVLAIGAVSIAGIVGTNVPALGQLISGQIPSLPASSTAA